ncbi:MAG: protein translocase subunit SecD [Patescibacteria group bacterium]
MRKRNFYILILIVAVALLAAVFVYPKTFDKNYNFRNWRLGLDLVGGSHLVYQVDLTGVQIVDRESVVNGLRDVIEKRVNLFGVSEPQIFISKAGENYRLVVELAGIKDVSVAIKEIGETPFLNFAEVDTTNPNDPKFNFTNLNGRYVSGAQLNFDQTTSRPSVNISFNDEGAKIFEELTVKNIGKPVAIFLDNQLIEMPVVQERIAGGQAQITGNFTVIEARQMVARFNAGALPAPIILVNQQTIGAGLGADSLSKTVWAGLIGTLLVVVFMLIYYRWYGLAAALALVIYVFLTLAIYKLFGVTMTLAGIAGFTLSIGMAVDANILIFERRKEEAKKGVSNIAAIEEGFRRAWPSIRDSNISTILTSIILYYFMTGFVRGFALTLLLGVIISMFSAITVTRTILKVFVRQ